MYGFEEMIELGLKKGQKFKSEAHRQVAVSIGICNPNINTLDKLINVVRTVESVPIYKIKTVSIKELIDKFGLQYL